MRIPIFLLLVALAAPLARADDPASGDDAQLIRMETQKWQASSLANPIRLLSMFSPEMLSVDPGADVHGGAERRTWKEIMEYGPLPAWNVDLGEWRVLHPTPDVAIVSYKVTGVSIQWKAYATSVWVRRDGRWKTTFYQASTAK
ncbi:MAG TPA: nuclear transport factor 2 family protein [Usitatibacter sp.]|nr:nuclear transport factor 2 family protein [Usitatibacter sp.]